MINLSDEIKKRIEEFDKSPEKALKTKGVEYAKAWNHGVDCFRKKINKERIKENKKEFSFIVIRNRLEALKEIDDLRWFYIECLKYSKKKDKNGRRNTFGKIFWGATKIK
jgi:hypothetical protein